MTDGTVNCPADHRGSDPCWMCGGRGARLNLVPAEVVAAFRLDGHRGIISLVLAHPDEWPEIYARALPFSTFYDHKLFRPKGEA